MKKILEHFKTMLSLWRNTFPIFPRSFAVIYIKLIQEGKIEKYYKNNNAIKVFPLKYGIFYKSSESIFWIKSNIQQIQHRL